MSLYQQPKKNDTVTRKKSPILSKSLILSKEVLVALIIAVATIVVAIVSFILGPLILPHVTPAPSVTITSPIDGSRVPPVVIVQGTASNIPQEKELWLLVQVAGTSDYYPQAGPMGVSSDSKWSTTAYLGSSSADSGRQFVLYTALVDQNSAGRAAIDQYFAHGKETGQYLPLKLPLKGIELISQVRVVRT